MAQLVIGTVLKTVNNATVKVEHELGEGGQGYVYKVMYNGRPKALKWYKIDALKNPDWFYNNLKNNIELGKPADNFLWPEDLTLKMGGTFGYIMDLRSPDYVDFGDILLAKERFRSFRSMTESALNIVTAFYKLHRIGYTYQDLNDGNFFIRLKDGAVMICDNDNVSEVDNPSGIAGKARYMAPSVVVGKHYPDKKTDRYSLAVCLFLMFTGTHPLEGVRTLSEKVMNEFKLRKHYGEIPLFIADDNDHSNGPNKEVHKNFYTRWPLLSEELKNLFRSAFSQEAMLRTERFPLERDWCKALLQYRTNLIRCPECDRETLIDDHSKPVCKCCKRPYDIYGILKVNNYSIPLVKNVGVYVEHLDDFSDVEYKSEKIGIIKTRKSDGVTGLLNLSDSVWSWKETNGKVGTVTPGDVLILKNGMTIKANGQEMTVNL